MLTLDPKGFSPATFRPAPPANIVVYTPTAATYHDNYVGSILTLQLLATQRGVPLRIERTVGGLPVPMARTLQMRHFLHETQGTHLVFIDSDQGFDAKDVFDLIDLDLPIVGAVCCQKRYDWHAIGRAAPNARPDHLPLAGAVFTFDTGATGNDVDITQRKAIPVRRVGFGFTVIQRKVIETVEARTFPKVNMPGGGRKFGAICAQRIVQIEGTDQWEWLTEDYAFCSRAADVGFQAYLAWWTKTTHSGEHVFRADLEAASEMLGQVVQDQQ